MSVTSNPMRPTAIDLPSLSVLAAHTNGAPNVGHFRVPGGAFQLPLFPTSVPDAGDNPESRALVSIVKTSRARGDSGLMSVRSGLGEQRSSVPLLTASAAKPGGSAFRGGASGATAEAPAYSSSGAWPILCFL